MYTEDFFYLFYVRASLKVASTVKYFPCSQLWVKNINNIKRTDAAYLKFFLRDSKYTIVSSQCGLESQLCVCVFHLKAMFPNHFTGALLSNTAPTQHG